MHLELNLILKLVVEEDQGDHLVRDPLVEDPLVEDPLVEDPLVRDPHVE